ncbi:hypothetical protein GCM10019016_072740 [Streptomyces prasinosporus]|uniref:NUDIX hydrolase n=1 Tax=Streptomyces prasinosporus TaxID=68256 RepID=A0ABP6TZQ4_9ACTN
MRAPVRHLFTFLGRGVIGPYWLGVHEALVVGDLAPDPGEVAWWGWLTEEELPRAVGRWEFVRLWR